MVKKGAIIFFVLLMLFAVVGCEEDAVIKDQDTEASTNATDDSSSSSGGSGLAGVYVYEKYEGDLPFIITSHVITLSSDKTYNIKHVWDSNNQTVTGDNDGVWDVVDGDLVLTNASDVETIYKIDKDRIIETMYFGFGENAYPVEIYFKKE
ncbi:MAG: hypothetical protein ACLFPS_06020 [Clostridia bacterium]